MPKAEFDVSATFNDDYLWFYEQSLTDERNEREAKKIVDILGLEDKASILDAPCGHGRLSNILAARGHDVTGVDITPLFLDRAKGDATTSGVAVDYRMGDLRQLPVDGPFDVVICWYTSFGYFDDAGNQAALSEFARVLRPGGTLLIEVINRDGLVRNFNPAPAANVVRRADDMMIDTSTFDPVTGRLETERTVVRGGSVRRSNFFVRLPTVPEFDNWLRSAGFSSRTYSDGEGEALSYDSRRLLVSATKAP